jgi:hypothetical protein
MLKRLLPVLLVALATSFSAGTPAYAAGPVSCPSGQWDSLAGVCVIAVTTPGSPTTPGTPGTPVTSGTPAAPQKCVSPYSGKDVPCQDGSSWYSNSLGCYISLTKPQPPKSDPLWNSHADGAIYDCYTPELAGNKITNLWSATSPAGPAAPPDPAQLAQQALSLMRLKAITVGIVPDPSGVGLVGMPNWMWVTNPTANTWGPLTRSASAAGWTVTATAQVSKVTWNMGDGQVVVCNGPGTRYQDSYGKQQSPDCGHTYTRQGAYTVRATSHWVITWAGIGQTGTIPMDLTNTAALTIGEAQVLRQ